MGRSDPRSVEILEHDGFIEARYLGPYSLDRCQNQMKISVRACKEKGATVLLLDIRALTKFSPTTQERFELGKYAAEIGKNFARVAVLVTPEQMDPDKFATLVARNRGLQVRAFIDEQLALKWLLKR